MHVSLHARQKLLPNLPRFLILQGRHRVSLIQQKLIGIEDLGSILHLVVQKSVGDSVGHVVRRQCRGIIHESRLADGKSNKTHSLTDTVVLNVIQTLADIVGDATSLLESLVLLHDHFVSFNHVECMYDALQGGEAANIVVGIVHVAQHSIDQLHSFSIKGTLLIQWSVLQKRSLGAQIKIDGGNVILLADGGLKLTQHIGSDRVNSVGNISSKGGKLAARSDVGNNICAIVGLHIEATMEFKR
jgi:hypothetical protein